MKRYALLLLASAPLFACPVSSDPEDPTPAPIDLEMGENEEGTSPIHSMLPWPSDTWLAEDSSTVTGWRLEYRDAAVPRNRNGEFFDTTPYRRLDGFSLGSQPMISFGPPVDMANLAAEGEYDESLAADSPTVLLNLDTGERVPHFIQNDLRVEELEPGSPTMVHMHPAAGLRPDTAYAVVYRDSVRLADGACLPQWPAFAALRDGTITNSSRLEARRPRYEAMFSALATAGVPREQIGFAWTFRTASDDAIQRELLAMRDDAITRVPRDGGTCTITDVDRYELSCVGRDDECVENAQLRARIFGTVSVPLYMERMYPPTVAALDEDGLPEFQGWHEVEFSMIVPHVAYENGGARFVSYAHGLMGSQGEVLGNFQRQMASEHNMIFASVDMHGMSEWDIVTVGQSLAEMSKFVNVTERLMQGHINTLVMTRAMTGGCRTLPGLADWGLPTELPLGDDPPYYIGISQGGIFGSVQAAISPDIERFALLVGGTNYSVMIPRSSNFPDYEMIFLPWYGRRLDQQVMLSMIMSLWDKSEPSGFAHRVLTNPLPGAVSKQVLHQVAVNDSQVPNLSSDMLARTLPVPLMTPTSKEVWGLTSVTSDEEPSSAMVYFDFGRELGAEGNVPPPEGNGVHGDQRFLTAAKLQIDAFFHPDGVVQDFCDPGDGVGCSPE